MKFILRKIIKIMNLAGLIVLTFMFEFVLAADENYPTRPVTIHVGVTPGASAGATAQIFADGIQKYLTNRQPFIVNFKPGAATAVAADFVLKNQPADGYNLLWCMPEIIGKMAKDKESLSFSKEDFIHIGAFGYSPMALGVKKESHYKTLEEFIDYGKKHPGEISSAVPGVGGVAHLTAEVFTLRTGVKFNIVPFAGGTQTAAAVLGGHMISSFNAIATYGDHIKPGGGLRLLTVLTDKRIPDFPDVPTCKEKGYDVVRETWFYLAAPKGTPKTVVDTLRKAFEKTAGDPQIQLAVTKTGVIPLNLGPEESEKKANIEFDLACEVFRKGRVK